MYTEESEGKKYHFCRTYKVRLCFFGVSARSVLYSSGKWEEEKERKKKINRVVVVVVVDFKKKIIKHNFFS